MAVKEFEKHTEIPEIVAIQTVTVQLSREFKLHNRGTEVICHGFQHQNKPSRKKYVKKNPTTNNK